MREGIARLHVIIAQEPEGAAMNRIGARFGLGADHASAGDAKLGVVVGGGDLGFGHRFECWIDDDPTQHGVVIIGAIQQVAGAGEALSIDQHPVRALRILGGSRSQRGGEGNDARRHQLKVGEAAAQHRQIRNRSFAVSGCDIAAFGLQDSSFGAHFEGLRHVAHLQLDFEAGFGIHRYADIVLHHRFKARGFDSDAIAADN